MHRQAPYRRWSHQSTSKATTWTVITRTSVSRKGRAIPQDTRMLPVLLLALGALITLPLTALGLPGT
ncbi:MAG: hypothetical protein ACO3F5_07465, partial [Gemmatimonadaceae bacterium]